MDTHTNGFYLVRYIPSSTEHRHCVDDAFPSPLSWVTPTLISQIKQTLAIYNYALFSVNRKIASQLGLKQLPLIFVSCMGIYISLCSIKERIAVFSV